MELLQALDRFLAENVKDVSVDAQAVLAHVIRPPSYAGASSDRGVGAMLGDGGAWRADGHSGRCKCSRIADFSISQITRPRISPSEMPQL
jgi:hypothetical protein